MDQLDHAIYATAHKTKDTCKKLATQMGMSHQVLLNKVNFNNETHHLTLRESIALQLHTGDKQILHASASELGSIVQEEQGPPGISLTEATLNIGVEFGELMSSIRESIADGRVTEQERALVRKEMLDVIRAANDLGIVMDSHTEKSTKLSVAGFPA